MVYFKENDYSPKKKKRKRIKLTSYYIIGLIFIVSFIYLLAIYIPSQFVSFMERTFSDEYSFLEESSPNKVNHIDIFDIGKSDPVPDIKVYFKKENEIIYEKLIQTPKARHGGHDKDDYEFIWNGDNQLEIIMKYRTRTYFVYFDFNTGEYNLEGTFVGNH